MKQKKKKICLAAGIFLITGLCMDLFQIGMGKGDQLERGKAGEDPKEYTFMLEAEEVLEDYEYHLSLGAELLDEQSIEEYLKQAMQEIDETFCKEGDEVSYVTQPVNMAESYAGGVVSAAWSLDNYEAVDPEGNILSENISKEGVVVNAVVELQCYEKTELYQFSFVVYPPERSQIEQLIYDINKDINDQMEQVGEKYFTLPSEVDGIALTWYLKKQHYFFKILALEVILGIGMQMVQRERKEEEEKKKREQMKQDYPEIVSKILILCGAGMSIQQAWNKISVSYLNKKEKKQIKIRFAYEEMITANREITDGESESVAWVRFGERTGLRCYHRLGHLLVESRKKGAKGMYSQLKQEADEAFQERKDFARKLGEKAGTKLLLPMILMLGIVMAIVIMPAITGYTM